MRFANILALCSRPPTEMSLGVSSNGHILALEIVSYKVLDMAIACSLEGKPFGGTKRMVSVVWHLKTTPTTIQYRSITKRSTQLTENQGWFTSGEGERYAGSFSGWLKMGKSKQGLGKLELKRTSVEAQA